MPRASGATPECRPRWAHASLASFLYSISCNVLVALCYSFGKSWFRWASFAVRGKPWAWCYSHMATIKSERDGYDCFLSLRYSAKRQLVGRISCSRCRFLCDWLDIIILKQTVKSKRMVWIFVWLAGQCGLDFSSLHFWICISSELLWYCCLV